MLIVADAHKKDAGQTSQSVRHLENVPERPHHRSIDLGPIWPYNAMGVMLAFFLDATRVRVSVAEDPLCADDASAENTQQKAQSSSADITQCPL